MPQKMLYSTATDYHLLRPGNLIADIYNKVSDKCQPFMLFPDEILVQPGMHEEPIAWFFTHGMFSTYRRIDKLQVFTSFATPESMSVFGLAEGLMKESFFILKAETPCEGFSFNLKSLYEKNDPKLWQNISELLSWFIKLAVIRDHQLVGVSSYSIIRSQLITLMSYSEEFRLRVTALAFIKQRTNLSRSNILRVFNELQVGEYISMHRGHLLGFRYLPLHF
ncbi:MAG: helix-turn-helix domain-containing protein [Hafnia sp.]|jgi:hypothetical protein